MGTHFEDLTEGNTTNVTEKRPQDKCGGPKNVLTRYRQESEGAVLVLFALMVIPLLAFIGFAFELALTETVRVRLQNTTDSASLASADLEQVLDPEELVEDFFAKAGLADNLDSVTVVDSPTARSVTITASEVVPPYMTQVVDWEQWNVSVVGAATESRQDLEIAIALDNSGSMSWAPGSTTGPAASPSRMDLLIPAALSFVDAVQPRPGQPGNTMISLVPFATQVSVGEALLSNFNVSDEHSTSHCVTFRNDADYTTTAISPSTPLRRTAHHDGRDFRNPPRTFNPLNAVCPTNSAVRDIVPWAEDPEVLKDRIRAMQPYGFTSIEMATKWGAAMLDPSLRPVLASLSTAPGFDYLSGPASRGVPDDYNSVETVKYLIVMSDGANTNSYDIRPPFREGNSPVFRVDRTNSFVYFLNRAGPFDYFHTVDNRWRTFPGSGAVRMTWPEVWAEMPPDYFATRILALADRRRSAFGHYLTIVERTFDGTKNPRTSAICTAAKNQGITIFTIGMDTFGQGDATLADCASAPGFFFDVDGLDIERAFESIAREINRLRLTQ